MISTNIDGSVGGSNQLFDLLLEVVAKPDAYTEKLKALEEATAENKKIVALVAPAAEIVDLRDQLKADKEQLKQELKDAKDQAAKKLAEANEQAAVIRNEAQAEASKILADASAQKAETTAINAEAKKALSQTKASKQSYDKANAELLEQQSALAEAIKAADDAKVNFETLKAEVIAKHQKFIASL